MRIVGPDCAVLGSTVRCRTDNAAVVNIVNTGRSKDELAMHLMRCLAFFTAHFQLTIRAEHLPGRENGAADSLSRNKLAQFRLQVPWAWPQATAIPRELLDMILIWAASTLCFLRVGEMSYNI